MSTVKDEVRRILDHLPDDATYQEIQYHIYAVQKIERGLQDIEQGRLVSHKEVVQRMAKWIER